MTPTLIESPYAGAVATNVEYARAALRDSLMRGEAPLASHLLYPQVLDDQDPEQRALGMRAAWTWVRASADVRVVFYVDRGMSPGMRAVLALAFEEELEIEFRSLHGDERAIERARAYMPRRPE